MAILPQTLVTSTAGRTRIGETMRHATPLHPHYQDDRTVAPTPTIDHLWTTEVRRLHADVLIAELAELEERIRLLDPYRDASQESDALEPTVVDLVEAQYRILRELRRRRVLLNQGIRWTTLWPGGRQRQ